MFCFGKSWCVYPQCRRIAGRRLITEAPSHMFITMQVQNIAQSCRSDCGLLDVLKGIMDGVTSA